MLFAEANQEKRYENMINFKNGDVRLPDISLYLSFIKRKSIKKYVFSIFLYNTESKKMRAEFNYITES